MASQAQIINKAFQIKLNEGNKDKFTSLLKWCQENGLIDSFIEIANGNSTATDNLGTDEDTEAYLSQIVKESEEDYKNGNFLSHEDAQDKLKEWRKNQK